MPVLMLLTSVKPGSYNNSLRQNYYVQFPIPHHLLQLFTFLSIYPEFLYAQAGYSAASYSSFYEGQSAYG
jgi:hypothetical protein